MKGHRKTASRLPQTGRLFTCTRNIRVLRRHETRPSTPKVTFSCGKFGREADKAFGVELERFQVHHDKHSLFPAFERLPLLATKRRPSHATKPLHVSLSNAYRITSNLPSVLRISIIISVEKHSRAAHTQQPRRPVRRESEAPVILYGLSPRASFEHCQ